MKRTAATRQPPAYQPTPNGLFPALALLYPPERQFLSLVPDGEGAAVAIASFLRFDVAVSVGVVTLVATFADGGTPTPKP